MNLPRNAPTLAKIGFVYHFTLRERAGGRILGRETIRNVFTTEGMNYVLDAALGSRAKLNAFFLGLFEANYTPTTADTAAAFPAAATETTAYTPSTRVAFTPNAVSAATISNVGLEGQFTFTADKTIYGAFVASAQAKGATTGVLISAARFGSAQVAKTGNVLQLQAGCQLINV